MNKTEAWQKMLAFTAEYLAEHQDHLYETLLQDMQEDEAMESVVEVLGDEIWEFDTVVTTKRGDLTFSA